VRHATKQGKEFKERQEMEKEKPTVLALCGVIDFLQEHQNNKLKQQQRKRGREEEKR
jgi:hypothetical protein